MFEDDLYRIDYFFSSFLNNDLMGDEPNDFVNEISLNIYQVNDEKETNKLIGRGYVSLLLLNRAIDMGYPLVEIFDTSQTILDMAEVIFDTDEEGDFWSKLDEYFDYDLPTSYDTCFVEGIELLPEFRGKGIGKWVLKNIMERFYGSSGLVVVRAFPLQHAGDGEMDSQWRKLMKYELLEGDLEQAQYKLFHYYQQLGFSKPFEEGYFLVRPEEFDFDQFWGEESTGLN